MRRIFALSLYTHVPRVGEIVPRLSRAASMFLPSEICPMRSDLPHSTRAGQSCWKEEDGSFVCSKQRMATREGASSNKAHSNVECYVLRYKPSVKCRQCREGNRVGSLVSAVPTETECENATRLARSMTPIPELFEECGSSSLYRRNRCSSHH